MRVPRELVIQINQEEKELNEKLTRLEYFMMTEDYQRISERQKLLLKDQHEVMDRYKRILIARAIQINFEEKNKEEPAEEKDCRDCANSLDGGKHCTGDKEHGWVDTTGEKKCFAPKDPDTEPAEQMPDLVVPGLRTCWNCKHGTKVQTGPGQVNYGCDSKMQCYDHSEWEEQDGTSLDK